MGFQIIKQTLIDDKPFLMEDEACTPGLYAVWDSVGDNFAYVNCTREELIDFFVERERKRITDMLTETLARLDAGQKRTQFCQTFSEAIAEAKRVHGQGAFDERS